MEASGSNKYRISKNDNGNIETVFEGHFVFQRRVLMEKYELVASGKCCEDECEGCNDRVNACFLPLHFGHPFVVDSISNSVVDNKYTLNFITNKAIRRTNDTAVCISTARIK
jgi:hypothetical protein